MTPGDQVTEADLQPVLHDLFSSARDRLVELGRLVSGGGGNYALVPHQNGSSVQLSPEAYIAGFFSDGRMLLGESNEAFNATLEATFGTFRSKIVDVALQTGGFKVLSPDHIDNAQECASDSWGGYGAEWVDMVSTSCFELSVRVHHLHIPLDTSREMAIRTACNS